jgi:hypothetical protein
MKYVIMIVVTVVLMVGSYVWNDYSTPRSTDDQYITKYRILNATKMTDEEILTERAEDDASRIKWKHTNSLLQDEVNKQGKEELYKSWTMQKQLYQIQFYNAYYEHGVSAEEFVSRLAKD